MRVKHRGRPILEEFVNLTAARRVAGDESQSLVMFATNVGGLQAQHTLPVRRRDQVPCDVLMAEWAELPCCKLVDIGKLVESLLSGSLSLDFLKVTTA
jgi:hypothetical protein